jgi:hypothetical protein
VCLKTSIAINRTVSMCKSIVLLGRKFYITTRPTNQFGLFPMYGMVVRRGKYGAWAEVMVGDAKVTLGYTR